MDDFALTPAERAFFQALNRRSARFLVIGMGAAVLEGAPFVPKLGARHLLEICADEDLANHRPIGKRNKPPPALDIFMHGQYASMHENDPGLGQPTLPTGQAVCC